MSNDVHNEWKTHFEDAQSSMEGCSYDAACTSYLDALRVAETGRISAAELADTLEGLAVAKISVGEEADVTDLLDRAEAARQRVLEETIAESGQDHLKTADVYDRLAFHNIIRGRPEIAVSYFEKKLAIQQLVFGERHFEVANTLIVIGGMYSDESENEKVWVRAVEILQHLFENPDECDADSAKHVAISLRGVLENPAVQAQHENRIDDAEKYFRRAIATCSVTVGKQSCVLCNAAIFGEVLLAQRKYDECEALLNDALSNAGVLEKRTLTKVLADLYDQTGRSNEARTLTSSLAAIKKTAESIDAVVVEATQMPGKLVQNELRNGVVISHLFDADSQHRTSLWRIVAQNEQTLRAAVDNLIKSLNSRGVKTLAPKVSRLTCWLADRGPW